MNRIKNFNGSLDEMGNIGKEITPKQNDSKQNKESSASNQTHT